MHPEDIAIIGMGCRFPGGLNDIESFWRFLIEGGDAVVEIPADRWNIERFYDPEPGLIGKSIAKWGGFVDGIEQFDPQFFGISPREAPYIDPQQRLLLETAWEAMEDAGIVLDQKNGTDIGVFVGVSHTDYQSIQGSANDRGSISPHSPTGNAHSIAANRISYCFNLTGPSIAMDTACSSALTAVHVACEQLRSGRCATALAGGVTVMITPDGFIGFSQAGMLSPDGRCKAFDASANGFVRGEGAGMVVLKPVARAVADGDPIYAVIRGTSANQDGHTNGISLPGEEAQTRLVEEACRNAGVDPLSIHYVEAHGTGTAVGDPIEARALAAALCVERSPEEPLVMGSVKTNLGHLETAAGVASLIKSALVVSRGQIPPSLHFETPNPNIDFEACRLRVPTRLEPFPETGGGPRLVGVNSFGFGGANAHVILAEPPARPLEATAAPEATEPGRFWPVALSARSEESLREAAGRLLAWLEDGERAGTGAGALADLVYTLGARRNHHSYRLTAAVPSLVELAGELRAFVEEGASPGLKTAFTPQPEHPLRVGFVFSGQGPQWWGMGRELMRTEPVFRQAMEACAAAMAPHAGFSLLEELAKSEAESRIMETEIAQPAIFAMQVALADLWKSWGVSPAAIVGHSVGEIAAACAAGILPVGEAARVIVLRARAMHGCARGEGTMLAVALAPAEAEELIARVDPSASIAAYNGPRSLTLSGPRASLEAMAAELESREVFARFVKVDHPFHHALMQPAADRMEAELAALQPHPETVPFFSTVTGARQAGEACQARHWACGIRQSVQFVPAVQAMADHGVDVWLEISSHPALANSLQECLAAADLRSPVVSSVRRDREQASIQEAALDLHRLGVVVDFAALTPSRRLLALPAYPWKKERWWHESGELREGRLAPGGRGLLDMRLPRSVPTWMTRLDGRHLAFLRDHQVDTHLVFPGAGFVEMALEAGVQLFEGRPFAIEDFEIRKPLILNESAQGVILELTYEPGERTFSIQSRFEPSTSWSVHAVGSLRSERVESSFESSHWESPDERLGAVDVGEFYDYMHGLGLRYGPEFRAVRELSAGAGESAGLVSLSEAVGRRAGEYALHPVILDAALHVFSAGARTVEDRRSKMKLPVRFSRILYSRSPGASSRVRARVLQCNEELIEGRIGLYDESGLPCVLVDGFRAVAMASVRRAGSSSGGGRDLVYHIDWERTAASTRRAAVPPVPLEELHRAAGAALGDVLALRERERLEEVMAAEDRLAAAQIAAGLVQMGVRPGGKEPFSADSLGVAASLRPVFHRLMEKLESHGALTAAEAGYRPGAAFGDLAASAPAALRDFLTRYPGHLPEGLLCAATGADFGPILRGEKDAVQALFSGPGTDLLEHFYGDGLFSSHWMAGIGATLRTAERSLPDGRGLRILEVGAGTGGLAAYILPLLERGLHRYVFSDVSAGFFPLAHQKLAAFPEVEFQAYDLDKAPEDQGFETSSFDFIVGTNVLHAVADVRNCLGSLHRLLAPGGTLVFMDVATPQLWTESIFGLTSGWWHFTDRDLRPVQPLLPRETWEQALRETGFQETASLPGLRGPFGEGQFGMLARKAPLSDGGVGVGALTEAGGEAPAETSWVVFGDRGGLGRELASRLADAGARCQVVLRPGPDGAAAADGAVVRLNTERPEAWAALADGWLGEADPPRRFVYLWSLDDPDPSGALMGTDDLLHFSQALDRFAVGGVRIDVVTRGAQPAGRDGDLVSPGQGPAIGLFRVILSEHPSMTCRGIDLPPADGGGGDLDRLWGELLRTDSEREVALRGEARYVQRLTRGLPVAEGPLEASTPMRLQSRERGILDSLRFAAFPMPECAPGEVLIRVSAAGLNFRDVLKALGLYPAETADARMFGDEVAGEIVAVGDGVDHVQVGDQVFGLAVFGLATFTLARAEDVRLLPAGMTLEEAATVPVVFMTAWHALKNVARVRPGETVLVHAGAGGVGMAAIQIARHLGAEVIASAGSVSKRSLLLTLGVSEVIDSRRGDFAERILELTQRRGVDVVLNALASEAIPMGLSCLAEFGRFVEIGKRDIYQNSRLPLWHLRRNASFHVVAMDAVFAGDAALTKDLMAEIAGLMESGDLKPLPYRAFPANRVDAAFRLMAAGKHIGKVVLSFAEPFLVQRGERLRPPFAADPEATYLITGGFGGFGKVLSRWLVSCGARHLVLTSRQGLDTPGAAAFVEELKGGGAEALAVRADVGSRPEVARLFEEIRSTGRSLKGVFHLAMVIDDAPLADLTEERFRIVMTPKALGAWLIHEQTANLDLDAFVLFSSVSSVFGNPAQGNYSAANAFLDSLAHYRRTLGLPALAVNWGVLGGDGYVARNERVAEYLARQGTEALTPAEVVSLLETFLEVDATQVAALRVDWSKWRQSFRGLQDNPLLERIFASGVELEEAGGATGDWRGRIDAATPEDRDQVIVQALQDVVGSVLRVKPESLRPDQPLTDLGLDSLMGVEIENLIESSIGVTLPPTSLMRARTIGQIAAIISGHLGGGKRAGGGEPAAAPAVAEEAVSVSDLDLDAISDLDIDGLLDGSPAPEEKGPAPAEAS